MTFSGTTTYDTEQKLEDYYKGWERSFFNKTGLSPESPEAREWIADLRNERPLVAVEPFAIFVDNDGNRFSVREIQPSLLPLVELESREQSKHLIFTSSLEKNWILPRFTINLTYSEDGIYERCGFLVRRKDGSIERVYVDTKRIGIFDIMHVYDYENGVQTRYRLNDLTWELVYERPLSITEKQPERDVENENLETD